MTGPSRSQDNLPLGERLARRWLDDWRGAAALVALLALASSITSLANGFAYDDVPIIFHNRRVHEWRELWRLFGQPYWYWVETGDGALYRPLVLALFGVQWAIGGSDPLIFHLVNVVAYVAIGVLVLALLRRLLPYRIAAAGAALWAVHPVHVESVGNVVGQGELIPAICILLALVVYADGRRRGQLSLRRIMGIAALYAVALLSKEHAVVFPALIVALDIVGRRVGLFGRLLDREASWLLGRVLGYETAIYLTIRWVVLVDHVNIPHVALLTADTATRLWTATGLWPEIGRLLVWPARLYADYSPQQIAVHATWHPVHLVSLGMLVAWAVVTRAAWQRRDGALLLGCLWFPLTYGIISNLLFPTGVLIAERTLFLPSVSVALVAGVGVQALSARLPTRSPVLVGLLALVLAAGAWRSAERQRDWTDSLTVFSRMIADAPENARANVILGDIYMQLGALDRAEPLLARAQRLDPVMGLTYAKLLHKTGRCDRVLQILPAALAIRETSSAQVTYAACLLQVGRFSDARRRAFQGLAKGQSLGSFSRLALVADSLLASTDSIDGRNRWVREGRPFDRTGAPITIRLAEPPLRVDAGLFGGREAPGVLPF